VTQHWTIDRELLAHLSRVSRLELTEEEQERFTEQLKVILEAFREIDGVDTEGVEPSFQPLEVKNVWREDVATDWDWSPLANSRHRKKSHIKGPRIV
jgi:aspartyl-tRNA(Asn)/glutamyl-tRNA(Gln) amidotransferase subunit C